MRFTHPDRVYWADVGVTKQDLADYYRMVWDWMAPHVVDRPLSLVRCPDGTKGECFFQKHASAGLDDKNLRTVIDKNKRQIIAVEDLDGLLSLVQAGVLEVHVRGSMIDHLELCDRIVFDLDPGEGVTWADLVRAARDVRERLAAIKLESFVKLSGGKGLHVVVPIEPQDWETTKTFVQAFAHGDGGRRSRSLRGQDDEVAARRKNLRRLSAQLARTDFGRAPIRRAPAPARPVSAPVTWQELGRTTGGNQYTVLKLGKRLGALKADPWKDITRVKQKLPDLRKR